MTTHKLNGYEIALPEIPEGATEVSVIQGKQIRYKDPHRVVYKSMPFLGYWQLFKLSEVPDELAGGMVESKTLREHSRKWIRYKDYEIHGGLFIKTTARASLLSWVRAQGVTETDPYLLIKKMD